MAAKRLAILAVTILAACGGESRDSIAADSLSRDLQLAPADSSAELGDYATAAPAPAAPAKPVAPKPKAKPRPQPAPAPASGTIIATAVDQEINSKTNKKGEVVTTTVSSDVTDSRGRVIIPAGSKVTMTITEIRESENKGDQTGKLTLTPTEVAISGRSYPLAASAEALDRQLKDRKTNAGDVAKVGAGAAIGALAGRVIGGNTKGAVIGGVIGGAVGTQRAVETQDRDVVVPAGSRVQLTLQGGLII
jgi:hypothetical protein